MNKIKNYGKILNLIKDKPQSQTEIREILGKDKISMQGVSKHLKRLVDKREIAYFGNKVNKLHTKILLRDYYGERGWPVNSKQVYIYTPESGNLYRKIVKKYKKKHLSLIGEIVRLHQVIEVFSRFQEMYTPEGTKMKRDMKKFYKERYKRINFNSTIEFNQFVKIIKMNPIMHWMAYRYLDMKNELTTPMFNKLGELFVKVKNED